MTTTSNGRTERKSLAGQLDRLDRILDGLSDGLHEAVGNAVKQAVTAAVEAAVVEVLTSPELQRRLRPEPEGKPGLFRRAASAVCRGVAGVAKGCWVGARALAGRCRTVATEAVSAMRQGGAVVVTAVRRGMTAFARLVWLGWFAARGLVRRFRKPLLVVVAAGTAVGVAGYLARPAMSSLASAVAVFVTALVAGAALRLRRWLRDIGWGEWDPRTTSWGDLVGESTKGRGVVPRPDSSATQGGRGDSSNAYLPLPDGVPSGHAPDRGMACAARRSGRWPT